MKFTTGSRVEVETFSQASRTLEFLPATVKGVEPVAGGLSDVYTLTDEGFAKVVRVGKRGGSRQIRLV